MSGPAQLTPICKFAAKELPHPRHKNHGEEELELLKAAVPFCLRLGIGLGVEIAGGFGRERIDVVFVVGDGGGVEVDEGLV